MIKQVIVVRKDLNMRKGKLAAQSAHASLKVFLDRMHRAPDKKIEHDFTEEWQQNFDTSFTPAMLEWLDWREGKPGFTKIVVGCNSEEELFEVEKQAKEAGIIHALIKDNGVTEFHGVQTPTCICLGPDEADKIDVITGKFSLL